MKHNMLALALGLALLGALPDAVSAQSLTGVSWNRSETTLIVDARPLQAQVLIDGRPLGSARELIAKAISVTPGSHTVEIRAPGFHRYVGEFTADDAGSATQFWVTLAPQ